MAPIKIGLMGFGRIGRNIFRIVHELPGIKIAAISEIMPYETIGYLLRWDTVHGPFPDEVEIKDDMLYVAGQEIKLVQATAPGDVNWRDYDVDVVVEATTRYTKKAELQKHLDQGAKRVILTVPPAEGEDIDIIVLGVNDHVLKKDANILSNGSVTINCLAPVLKLLHEAYGIKHASMTSVHAYTNAQRLADVPTEDYRSSRSAAENIIPAPTSAPQVIGKVLPELEGKLNGIAMNVPIPDGSVVDLVTELTESVTVDQVNNLMKSAAGSRRYANVMQYADDAIVSSDIIGNLHSAIFDSRATRVLDGNLLKTLTWFDNGWGYSCRVVELIGRLFDNEQH